MKTRNQYIVQDELDRLREQQEQIEAEKMAAINKAWRHSQAEKVRKEIRKLGHKPCC